MLRDYHVDNNALIVFFALKLSKALIRVKHTNNGLDMFLPGSCYTSHIKTPLSVLSGLWSVVQKFLLSFHLTSV